MKNNPDFNKSNTDDWKTPQVLYNVFIKKGFKDPCPFNASFNGLEKNYKYEDLFINPPYSKINVWVDYAIKQYENHNNVVLLIPARTDTKYFHKLLQYDPTIYFIKGRLAFNDCGKKAPFPSMLIELVHGNPFWRCWFGVTLDEYINTLL